MISLGAYEYNANHANLLGSGAFAFVYKGHIKNKPDVLVAIKIMKKDTNMPKNKTLLSKEISVLKDLNHANIVRLYDHGVSNNGVYLVMEYCNGGDLSEYLLAKGTLPEDTIRHFLIQIGSAMDAINRKGFMHRDLKPGNILLSHCRNCGKSVNELPGFMLTFKLADFGFARFLQDGMMAVTMCGSPMYMAPEVLMCRKYDAVADIWSMGIIVYQCLTGKAPFYANNPEALKNIYEKTVCLKPKIPVTTSRLLRDLLLRMLVRNPAERVDFDHFLSHPFLHQQHFEASPNISSGKLSPNVPVSSRRPGSEVAGGDSPGTLTGALGVTPFFLGPRFPTHQRDRTPQRNQPSPTEVGELDDEMSRTTVDDYFEDELDSSALPLESTPVSHVPNDPHAKLTPADLSKHLLPSHVPPVPLRVHYTPGSRPPDTSSPHVNQKPYGTKPLGELEAGETHLEDYVIVNRDGSEAERFSRGTTQYSENGPVSHVGRTVTNPAAYLASHPRAQCSGSPVVPDVAAGTISGSQVPGSKRVPSLPEPSTRSSKTPVMKPSCHSAALAPSSVKVSNRSPVAVGRRPIPPPESQSRQPDPPATETGTVERDHSPRNLVPEARIPPFQPVQTGVPTRGSPVTTRHSPIFRAGHPNLTNSGEYQLMTEAIRLRPRSGGGILDYDLAEDQPLDACQGAPSVTAEHNEEIKTITMVLELCELLAELAERRASVLADCTVTTSHTSPSRGSSEAIANHVSASTSSGKQSGSYSEHAADDTPSSRVTGLRFLSEAQRIVEQIVLYRRILYYLEYVFAQVKKAFQLGRLKSTPTSCRRLADCNTLYHRCYIRLRQLARLSRRDDLIEPVGRLLANVTANRLIFQYALVQCQAAEMDEYVGDIAQSIQRYKAGITLIHGLRQHAKSAGDKALLADCMRLLNDRYISLRTAAAKPHKAGCFGHPFTAAETGSSPERSFTPHATSDLNPHNPGLTDSPNELTDRIAEQCPCPPTQLEDTYS